MGLFGGNIKIEIWKQGIKWKQELYFVFLDICLVADSSIKFQVKQLFKMCLISFLLNHKVVVVTH